MKSLVERNAISSDSAKPSLKSRRPLVEVRAGGNALYARRRQCTLCVQEAIHLKCVQEAMHAMRAGGNALYVCRRHALYARRRQCTLCAQEAILEPGEALLEPAPARRVPYGA